jgi:hypothetical protein
METIIKELQSDKFGLFQLTSWEGLTVCYIVYNGSYVDQKEIIASITMSLIGQL